MKILNDLPYLISKRNNYILLVINSMLWLFYDLSIGMATRPTHLYLLSIKFLVALTSPSFLNHFNYLHIFFKLLWYFPCFFYGPSLFWMILICLYSSILFVGDEITGLPKLQLLNVALLMIVESYICTCWNPSKHQSSFRSMIEK